jgi:hypothetical protein
MARSQASRTPRGRPVTGRFASRSELTSQVWLMHRLQMFPNVTAIARACGTSVSAILTILENGEGREDYLARGFPTGA